MSTKKIEVFLGEKPGAQGFQGWSPVLSATANGTNIVLKVTDWVGGFGVKPAINVYVTAGGYTADINAATNIRGSGAVEPGDNVILSGGANITAKNHSCYLAEEGSVGGNTLTIPVVSQVMGFDCRAIVKTDGALFIKATGPNVNVHLPTSRGMGASFEEINFVSTYVQPFLWYMEKGVYELHCFNDGTTTHIYVF